MPKVAADVAAMDASEDERLAKIVERERGRLQSFIRRRVPNFDEAEDLLQEVFYELVRAERLLEPIEQVGAWLSRVARNRIIDLFRKRKLEVSTSEAVADPAGEDGEMLRLEDLLPSPDEGPEAAYARSILLDELEAALEELPFEQREAFMAHEIEGRSFKELAKETGVNMNTLLARKHYAVRRLRARLKAIYKEFNE